MRIGRDADVAVKAQSAKREAERVGKIPQRWIMGREVWVRLTKDRQLPETGTLLFGLPVVVSRSAPADLLELDTF